MHIGYFIARAGEIKHASDRAGVLVRCDSRQSLRRHCLGLHGLGLVNRGLASCRRVGVLMGGRLCWW
jgi:hypothetical protein